MSLLRLKKSFRDLLRWAVTLLFLLALLIPPAPVKANTDSAGNLLTLVGNPTKVCLGQSLKLSGYYSFVMNPLESLTTAKKGNKKKIPEPIVSTVSSGSVKPASYPVYLGSSGYFGMTYTPTEKKDVTITSTLFGAQDTLPIKVYNCTYIAILHSSIIMNFDYEGVTNHETYYFDSNAHLELCDPPQPGGDSCDEDAPLDYDGILDDFVIPPKKDSSITPKPNTFASGSAPGRVQITHKDNGDSIQIVFSKKAFKEDNYFEVRITGKGGSGDTKMGDFQKDFLFSFFNAGNENKEYINIKRADIDNIWNIKPDLDGLKKTCDFLKGPEYDCSYTATLQIKRMKK